MLENFNPGARGDAPVLLAITGASGSIYALKFMEIMQELGQEVHLIVSGAGRQVANLELGPGGLEALTGKASRVYEYENFAAPPASGSSLWRAMVILPCTMGTLAAVANGISQNLVHRAADCFLKERRPLVLVTRETPLNRTHLKNMLSVHEAGAVLYPAMPSFYHKPASIEEMAYFFAGRLAEFLGFEVKSLKRWGGDLK